MTNLHERIESIVRIELNKRIEGTIKTETDFCDAIASKITLMIENEQWMPINHTTYNIANTSHQAKTEKMRIDNGWLYRTLSNSGYAMCFVPD